MEATMVVTVTDLDQLALLLRAVYTHGKVRTLTLQPGGGLDGRTLAQLPTRIRAHGLTPIEWRMIELAVHGVSRSHIAQQLCLAPSSVSTYWARIYTKLDISSRAQLDAWYRAEVAKVVDAERAGADNA